MVEAGFNSNKVECLLVDQSTGFDSRLGQFEYLRSTTMVPTVNNLGNPTSRQFFPKSHQKCFSLTWNFGDEINLVECHKARYIIHLYRSRLLQRLDSGSISGWDMLNMFALRLWRPLFWELMGIVLS